MALPYLRTLSTLYVTPFAVYLASISAPDAGSNQHIFLVILLTLTIRLQEALKAAERARAEAAERARVQQMAQAQQRQAALLQQQQQQQAALAAQQQPRPAMQQAAGRGVGLSGYAGVYGTGQSCTLRLLTAAKSSPAENWSCSSGEK